MAAVKDSDFLPSGTVAVAQELHEVFECLNQMIQSAVAEGLRVEVEQLELRTGGRQRLTPVLRPTISYPIYPE